jgi:N6-adenosine-specific RNA methylase IME4
MRAIQVSEQLGLSLEAISAEINELHAALWAIGTTSIEKAIRVGELLAEAKAQLQHGKWLPWLEANVEFNRQTAANYLRIYTRRLEFENVQGIVHLTDAYALLAKDADKQQKAQTRAKRRADFQQRLLLGGLQNGTLPLPGPFEIILADPPWRYQGVTTTPDRTIEQHYPTCTVAEICAHCPDVALNAVLFLWATAPLLPEALEVMDAWGFRYKTNAVWDKEKIGMGYWFRIQHEHLLVGIRGDVPVPPEEVRISSVFRERRTQHSRKPLAVYEWLELAFPFKSKLEMYCRTPRHGWACWGNEITS